MRLHSPSSINTYKQCPRKYYYRYIKGLPTKRSIHLVRGSAVHKVLEDFYDIDALPEDIYNGLMKHVLVMFEQYWKDADFNDIELSIEELEDYYKESQLMVLNWFKIFWHRFKQYSEALGPEQAFQKLTPRREAYYKFEDIGIHGYIDAIEEFDGINLMDYKTSSKFEITEEYNLQLAIYAFMYYMKHKLLPNRVGIYFLRHGVKMLKCSHQMILGARDEIKRVKALTRSQKINDYSKNVTPLCKWSSGQCDFYVPCFEQQIL